MTNERATEHPRRTHFALELASVDEVAAIHAFIAQATQSTSPHDFFLNDLNTLTTQMRKGFTLKAVQGSTISGILHVHFPDTTASYANHVGDAYPNDQVAHMDIAAVSPSFRGRRLLRLLLRNAEKHLQSAHPRRRALYATVSPTNIASQRSFAAAGYTKVGDVTIHHDYPRHVLRKVAETAAGTRPGSGCG